MLVEGTLRRGRACRLLPRLLDAFGGDRSRSARSRMPTSASSRFRPVRIVMTLLARDERDIVAQHLAFHLAAGVDW